ncbi:MAG: hypothetical protein DRR42_23995 [Gammaproteobacteria bacterium]|nr:MAG: hypothetical protein DRR42_23995 [Gammaproteobacteria bacterium]
MERLFQVASGKQVPTPSTSQGGGRGFRTPTEIAIAEAIVFEIEIDGIDELVRYSENTLAAKEFAVGQKIRVTYIERGLGNLWRKIYISEISATD